jgi:hypothetical protein
MAVLESDAKYSTRVVALYILKVPVNTIIRLMYHGKIEHPKNRIGPTYLWSQSEIETLARHLGRESQLEAFRNLPIGERAVNV